ncbi:hypothetical protein RFI_25919 [Reticulomyxa filosa]|uniref:Uncharacterized protein n=1 Tax=Reticulomyxa filosa TaxID=46433 RepID=X6MDG3_RETFI|nr:hypothetical protein RFI_25919 [Reticulomyxa filosa]|eukprot:ETO11457.1 hypothetical protein RFI_25919 [Reticulomyxa filosa]
MTTPCKFEYATNLWHCLNSTSLLKVEKKKIEEIFFVPEFLLMSLFKAKLHDGTKIHTITLTELTMENLINEVFEATQPTFTQNVLMVITDGEFGVNGDTLITQVTTNKKISKMFKMHLSIISDTLDFYKTFWWNWLELNVEAVLAEQMMKQNGQRIDCYFFFSIKKLTKKRLLQTINELPIISKDFLC